MTLLKGRTFIVLIVLLIFFSIAATNFLNMNTALLIGKHVALYGRHAGNMPIAASGKS